MTLHAEHVADTAKRLALIISAAVDQRLARAIRNGEDSVLVRHPLTGAVTLHDCRPSGLTDATGFP